MENGHTFCKTQIAHNGLISVLFFRFVYGFNYCFYFRLFIFIYLSIYSCRWHLSVYILCILWVYHFSLGWIPYLTYKAIQKKELLSNQYETYQLWDVLEGSETIENPYNPPKHHQWRACLISSERAGPKPSYDTMTCDCVVNMLINVVSTFPPSMNFSWKEKICEHD